MRKYIFFFFIPILLFNMANQSLFAVEVNQRIPQFTIFDFRQIQAFSSSDFVNHSLSIMILWDTHCEKCLKALKDTWDKKRSFEELGVNVVTINTNNPDGIYEAMEYSKDSPYPVYYDLDKIVVESFGATYNEFFVYIIDKNLRILFVLDESLPDAGSNILQQLHLLKKKNHTSDLLISKQYVLDEEFKDNERQKVSISGEGKIRFLYVSLDNPFARGPYGEELVAGSTLKYYLVPRINIFIKNKMQLGSYIRVTNIEDEFLFGAPDFYSSAIFSPYIYYRFSNIYSATIGFYRLSISPLTIMRWDEKDNPPGAGGAEGACGACGGIAGGISAENLEELGPDIGFEGFDFNANFNPSFRGRFFYARPLIARDDFSRYHQHLLGSQISKHFHASGFIKVNYVGTFEQAPKNAQEETGFAKVPLKTDHLFSGILNITPFKSFRFTGETAYFNRSYSALDTFQLFSLDNTAGFAFLFESEFKVNFANIYQFKAEGAYLSIDKDFEPYFKAISYMPNRRGFRLRSEISSDKIGVILFFKSMKDIKDTSNKIKTMGIGTNSDIRLKDLPVKTYLYYSFDNIKDSDLNIAGDKRHILSLGISIEPNPQFSFLFSIQNVKEKTVFRSDTSRLIALYNFFNF